MTKLLLTTYFLSISVSYSTKQPINISKLREKRRFRKRSPSQLAAFLKYVSQLRVRSLGRSRRSNELNNFYDTLYTLLDLFFPEREITVTSADPHFITPAIKSIGPDGRSYAHAHAYMNNFPKYPMLRRKNRPMRAGRTDEAGALAKRVRAAVTRQDSLLMRDCHIRNKKLITR